MSSLGEGYEGELIEKMLRGLSEKYSFELLAPRKNVLFERLSDTRVKLVPLDTEVDRNFSLRDVYIYKNYFAKEPPSILFSHSSLSSRVGAMLSGVKKLVSSKLNKRGDKALGVMRGLYNLTTLLTVSTGDSVTMSLLDSGIDKDRIVRLPLGISAPVELSEELCPSIEELSGRRKFEGGDYALSYVASLEESATLFAGAMRLFPRFPFSLVVLTPSKFCLGVKHLASTLGIGSRVLVLDYNETVPEYFKSAKFFVYPSLDREEVPTLLARFMSLGVAPIASSTPKNKDTVKDMNSGLIFTVGDSFSLATAMEKLLLDNSLCERLASGARARFSLLFDEEKMIRAYDDFYKALLY